KLGGGTSACVAPAPVAAAAVGRCGSCGEPGMACGSPENHCCCWGGGGAGWSWAGKPYVGGGGCAGVPGPPGCQVPGGGGWRAGSGAPWGASGGAAEGGCSGAPGKAGVFGKVSPDEGKSTIVRSIGVCRVVGAARSGWPSGVCRLVGAATSGS